MLCCCWEGNLKDRKQEEGLEGHGMMACCWWRGGAVGRASDLRLVGH